MTWLHRPSEPGLWTVGFFDPQGYWQPNGGDFNSQDEAAARTAWLNGSPSAPVTRTHTAHGSGRAEDALDQYGRRDGIRSSDGDPESCPLCGGDIEDHVEAVGEGPHGEEVHNYRCLIAELSDVIHDVETSIATDGENVEPGVEDGWVRTLKLVEAAYKARLDHG